MIGMFPASRFRRIGATDEEIAALEALYGPDTERFSPVGEGDLRAELDRHRGGGESGYAVHTVAALREIAEDRELEVPARATKADLIELIEAADAEDAAG